MSKRSARLGYAAYVRGSNACGNSVAVGETSLYTAPQGTVDRVLLRDALGRVARFAAEREACAAACAAAWNNQTFSAIPVAHLKTSECAAGLVDVAGALTH